MSSEAHSDLVQMDVFEAIQKKYIRGRKENGEKWVGPRPLVCLHDEIIDALVVAWWFCWIRSPRKVGTSGKFDLGLGVKEASVPPAPGVHSLVPRALST